MDFVETVKFDEKGLVPAIAQDYDTKRVLMMAYMNKEALQKTIECGKAVFFSRSRQSLWLKGETSGNYLFIKNIRVDCDMDCILLEVEPAGPACHTGETTCFYRKVEENGVLVKDEAEKSSGSILREVYKTIVDRRKNPVEGSYTNYLFDKGIDKILKKVGEETAEVIIASKNAGNDELRYEEADLLYHLMVLMVEKGLKWEDIFEELHGRHGDRKQEKK